VSCSAQHSVTTNQIITTSDKKFGVVSKSGELLIDSIYSSISLFYNGGRKTLPPNNTIPAKVVELYLVRNDENQLAVFDKNGLKTFDFTNCFQIEVDEHTKTLVKIIKQGNNQLRSFLYDFDGQSVFEESFEYIAYIIDSDLIALIAEDGQNEEYYLYNPFTKKRLGPYTHFNIFNRDSNPLMGMEKEEFSPYTSLNVITVRHNSGSDYKWGMIDLKGNEILPIEYKYFRVPEENLKKRFINRATRPDGVEFLFYSYPIGDGNMLLFDEKLDRYEFNNESMTIVKAK